MVHGKPLNDAWFEWAPRNLRRRHDKCNNDLERNPIKLYHVRRRRFQDVGKGLQALGKPADSVRSDTALDELSVFQEMKGQLCKDIVTGKLVAFGKREGATLEETPIPIPPHLFPIDYLDKAIVDWDGSALTSSGERFVGIRVTKPPRKAPRKERVRGASGKKATQATIRETQSIVRPSTSETTRKRGRPAVKDLLRVIVRSLHVEGKLHGKYRNEQVAIIQRAAQ